MNATGWSAGTKLLACRTVSVTGDAASYAAVPMLLIAKGWTAAELGALYASLGFVQFAVSPFFATLASRIGSSAVHRCGLLVGAFSQLGLLLLLLTNQVSFWWVLSLRILYGVCGVTNGLSIQLVARDLLSQERLPRYNATTRGIRAAALAALPLTLSLAGEDQRLWLIFLTVDALSFFLASALVPNDPHKLDEVARQNRQTVGPRTVAKRLPWYFVAVGASSVHCLAVIPIATVAGPPVLDSVNLLRWWGLIASVRGLGSLAGAFLAPSAVRRSGLANGRLLGASLVVESLVLVVLIAPARIWLVAVCFFVSGVAESMFSVQYTSLLQTRVPRPFLPAMMSLDSTVSALMLPVGTLAVGITVESLPGWILATVVATLVVIAGANTLRLRADHAERKTLTR